MTFIPPPPARGLPSLGLATGTVAPAVKPPLSRNAVIALAVVLLHVGFIWALQSGLLLRVAELVVPIEALSQFVDPPAPKVEPAPPVPPAPVKKAITKAPPVPVPVPVPVPAPQPLAIADPTPSPNAPTGVITPQPVPAVISAPVAAAPAAPASLQLPSSDAGYLQNPTPPYPAISRRLGEQGKSTIRVLIGADGQPQRAEIAKSSGFDRLDQAAIATVMRWRYVPGKRNGVAEAMWFNVPINWVLE